MVEFSALNLGMFDFPWSVLHFFAGWLLAFLALRNGQRRLFLWFSILILALIGWEVFEVAQGRHGFGGAESGPNIIFDIIVGAAGAGFFLMTEKLKKKAAAK